MTNDNTFVRPSGPGWYRGDFHAHTTCSDGYFSPQGLMEAAQAQGLDFLAITDHNTIAAFEAAIDTPLLVIPGIEVTLIEGHFNIFGLDGSAEWMDWYDSAWYKMKPGRTLSQLLRQAHAENLVTSVNHPLLSPWEVRDLEVDLRELDCVENWNDPSYPDNRVENPRAVALWTNWLNAGYRIANIGGSDFHSPYTKPDPELDAMQVGVPVTVVFAERLDVSGILEGLRQRRAYFSMGPSAEFSARLDGREYIMGADLGQVFGKVDFTGRVEGEGQLEARLVRNGAVFASVRGSGAVDFSWQVELQPEVSAWYRLDVHDAAGRILAITNPFFTGPVVSPGSPRFGDYIPER